MGKYDDILNLDRPQLPNRKPMPMAMRAAQFAPFAALSGYSAAIDEEQRLTRQRIELTPHELERLSRRLEVAMACSGGHPQLTVTWFRPDARKTGGEYITESGRVTTIDHAQRRIILDRGSAIAFDNILSIDSNLFANYPDLD